MAREPAPAGAVVGGVGHRNPVSAEAAAAAVAAGGTHT